ncbi:hypothetical protein ACVJGD_004020 [Bradyrhizobium sp. USDA 10063]
MKTVSKVLVVVACATLLALSLASIAPTVVHAYEYCRRDVPGHMTSCSFDTMEQCYEMRSGIGGDCFRDPFLKDNTAAYARWPEFPGSKHDGISARRHR